VICPATLVIEVPSSQRMVFNCVIIAAGAPWSHVGQASQWHGRGSSPHSDPVRLQMGGCGRYAARGPSSLGICWWADLAAAYAPDLLFFLVLAFLPSSNGKGAKVPLARSSSSSDMSLDPWAEVAGLEARPPSDEAHGSLPGMIAHGSGPGEALDVGTIGWAGGAAAAVVPELPHSAGGQGVALELASLLT
jgi:hypothetical protein